MGNSFTHTYPNWRDRTYDKFKEAKDIEFEENKAGEFILPPIEKFTSTRQRQRVLQGYSGTVYRRQSF
jgi:hypothetical protein